MRSAYQPARHPDRDIMFQVYDLRERGLTAVAIAAVLGLQNRTVATWVAHPERFDPYLDEVALERALAGDGKVYDNLTIYEMTAFYDRVLARMDEEPYDPKLHRVEDSYNVGTRKTYWAHELANRLGIDQEQFMRSVRMVRKRLEEAA